MSRERRMRVATLSKRKYAKRTTRRRAQTLLAVIGFGPAPSHSTSLYCVSGADSLSAPLRAFAQTLRCSEPRPTGTGTKATTKSESVMGFLSLLPFNPRRASRAPQPTPGAFARPCRARAALSLRRRRVGLAPGVGEERRGPRALLARRSDRGAFLFGDFLLGKQEKVTCRGSTTHKFIHYIDNRAPARSTLLPIHRLLVNDTKPSFDDPVRHPNPRDRMNDVADQNHPR